MRHEPHHRPFAALGQMDVALDVDQPAQPLGRRVPEQPALEEAPAEPAEVRAREALARGERQLGKAELEVAQRDPAPRADDVPAEPAERASERRLDSERKPLE
jgi:hypothetical protein